MECVLIPFFWRNLTKSKSMVIYGSVELRKFKRRCVDICPKKALIFGDLNDPESDISLWIKQHGRELLVLKADMGTHPSVKYIGINEEVR